VPYEFSRLISNKKVGELIRKIQLANTNSKFAIGGITAHVIQTVKEMRRKSLINRKLERSGISAHVSI